MWLLIVVRLLLPTLHEILDTKLQFFKEIYFKSQQWKFQIWVITTSCGFDRTENFWFMVPSSKLSLCSKYKCVDFGDLCNKYVVICPITSPATRDTQIQALILGYRVASLRWRDSNATCIFFTNRRNKGYHDAIRLPLQKGVRGNEEKVASLQSFPPFLPWQRGCI